MNYYANKEYVSCSDLKRNARKHLNEPEPDWDNMPAIKFGSEVDAILTEEGHVSKDAKALRVAQIYRDKSAMPWRSGKYQHEFYRSMKWDFESSSYDLKMRGKLDIYYPELKGGTVEDIKTTSLRTVSSSSVAGFIDRFDYDMQLCIYMNLSRANMGVISILSHTGYWLHQVFIERDSELYRSGLDKLERHLNLWFES